MLSISTQIQIIMAAGFFITGVASFAIGLTILVTRSGGKDINTLATQSALLAKKGIAEEVAGLVGNIQILLKTLNEMVRTATGIGGFLIILGVLMMGIGYWIMRQIY